MSDAHEAHKVITKFKLQIFRDFTAMKMNVSEEHSASTCSPEDRGSMFLQNVDMYLNVYVALQPQDKCQTYSSSVSVCFSDENRKFCMELIHLKVLI